MNGLAEKALTQEEQQIAAKLLPMARTIALAHGPDDELESHAMLSLCRAIHDYRTAKFNGDLEFFVRLAIDRDLKDFLRSEKRRRPVASIDDLVDAEDLAPILSLPPEEAETRALTILRSALLKRFGRRPKLRDVAEWLGMHVNTLARIRKGESR